MYEPSHGFYISLLSVVIAAAFHSKRDISRNEVLLPLPLGQTAPKEQQTMPPKESGGNKKQVLPQESKDNGDEHVRGKSASVPAIRRTV